MYEKLTEGKLTEGFFKLIVAVSCAALTWFLFSFKNAYTMIVAVIGLIYTIIFLVSAMNSLTYPMRLKRFIKKLDEPLDLCLTNKLHSIGGVYFWLEDCFLDLDGLHRIDYGNIRSIKVVHNMPFFFLPIFISDVFMGAIDLRDGKYSLNISYGKRKSALIKTGYREPSCLEAIKLFTDKNSNIDVSQNNENGG